MKKHSINARGRNVEYSGITDRSDGNFDLIKLRYQVISPKSQI